MNISINNTRSVKLSGYNSSQVGGSKINGQVLYQGKKITQPCYVFLHERSGMACIDRVMTDTNGNYEFVGVNKNHKLVVVAIDPHRKLNAVIQDSVVPK